MSMATVPYSRLIQKTIIIYCILLLSGTSLTGFNLPGDFFWPLVLDLDGDFFNTFALTDDKCSTSICLSSLSA